ncbi:hypothetical protein SAMN02745134_00787 [Clostridium acidisoli DSM 12555]|uniref:Haemolysin XhlA n=1 Tax=Clostridium acidisoli DSM 12555 TaxID=1121291 RepID=A0A1W1X5R3_9CLOT|nr:hypothetical protein [Clostridium acidisoli]SMC19284.1 hypothetical protein SAMN02745134_00787 [Clostridium acidisoli DSM 12555]
MEDKDKTLEIVERLARIESKLDDFSDLRKKAEDGYNTAMQNSKDIDEIKESYEKFIEEFKTDNKHMWYTVGAIAVTIIGYLLKITVFK